MDKRYIAIGIAVLVVCSFLIVLGIQRFQYYRSPDPDLRMKGAGAVTFEWTGGIGSLVGATLLAIGFKSSR